MLGLLCEVAHSKTIYEWSQISEKGLRKVKLNSSNQEMSSELLGLDEYQNNKKKINKVVVLGDTGCRVKESALKNTYQECHDENKWPYEKISKLIEKENPDLIIHTGDYHYREKCSSDKCKNISKSVGYNWEAWDLDFFAPSRHMLNKAPWIFVRGNHEDCERAYDGYKKYLTSQKWAKECVTYESPEILGLGDLTIILMDTSDISDIPDPRDETAKLWKDRFDTIEKLLSEKVAKQNSKMKHQVWLVTHKPFYGFVPLAKAYAPVNINLRKFFENSKLSKKVDLILGGHLHSAELSKAKGFPMQLVVGNSGTKLDKNNGPISNENIEAIGYDSSKLATVEFGYALLERSKVKSVGPDKWIVKFKGLAGDVQYEQILDQYAQ